MRTLDRYVITSFAINYLISMAVLLSIYVLLDLFFNLDEFTQNRNLPMMRLLWAVVRYYGAHLFLYFAQISGVITLFAMAFTLLRLQRNNEFVAIVSSGVSLHRVALTVVAVGLALNALWLVNQELIIPRLAPKLAQDHEASALDKTYGVWFLRDGAGALLSASRFDHAAGQLSRVVLMQRGGPDRAGEFVVADRAVWQVDDDLGGVWRLQRGARLVRQLTEDGAIEILREPVDYFRSDLGPDDIALRQSTGWIQFLSRRELRQLRAADRTVAPQVSLALQHRLTTPIVSMLIFMIGIPIFISRQPGGVVQSGGRCLLICGLCFLFAFFSQSLSSEEFSAALAWLPLMVLTPVMVLAMDRIRT